MIVPKFINYLVELFFPRRCFVCKRALLNQEKFICITCLSKAPTVRDEQKQLFESLFWGILPIEKISTLWYYKKGTEYAHIIHAIKYYGEKKLAEYLGTLLANRELHSGFFKDIDYIIPIPIHKKRLKERGYNQAFHIAKGISSISGIPICNDIIIKSKQTDSQTHKSGFERHINPQNSFKLVNSSELKEDAHLLIVDDVLTTGATIIACAEEFTKIEGIKISVMTLCVSTY